MCSHITKIITVLVAIPLLSGCMAPRLAELRNPVPEYHEEVSLLGHQALTINSTHVAVGFSADNSVNFVDAGANQAGLIGFLVSAAMLSDSNADIQEQQKMIQPIRNAILQFNYGSKLRSAVKTSFVKLPWLNISFISRYPELQKENALQLLSSNKDDTILIIDSDYSFSPDFNEIKIVCYAAIHSRYRSRLVADGNQNNFLVYQKSFTHTHKLDQAYQDKRLAIQKWGENDGTMVTQVLHFALNDIARKIAQDINQKKS